jgi:class 3 adenylate cyclase
MAWLVMIVIPAVAFFLSLQGFVREAETSRDGQYDELLTREMDQFETDISLKNQIMEALGKAGDRSGLFPTSGKLRPSLPSNQDPGIFTPASFNTFLREIRHELGVSPLTLFMWGCDGMPAGAYSHPDCFSALNKPSQRAIDTIMSSLSVLPQRRAFIHHERVAQEVRKNGGNRLDRHHQTAENLARRIFGEFVSFPLPTDEICEFFSPRLGEGSLILYQRFLFAGSEPDAPVIGGLLIAFHSRLFPHQGIVRRAKSRVHYPICRRRVLRYTVSRPPDILPGFATIHGERVFRKPLPLSIAAMSYKGGHSFYEKLGNAGTASTSLHLPLLEVAVSSTHRRHPLRRFLPAIHFGIGFLIFGTAAALTGGLLFGIPFSLNLRWKLFASFALTVSIPLLAFWLAVSSYLTFQRTFENRQILSLMNRDLRHIEMGLAAQDQAFTREQLELRRELVAAIEQPWQETENILSRWSQKKSFAHLYYLHRDGHEFFSEAIRSVFTNQRDSEIPRDLVQMMRAMTTIYLISTRMDLRTEPEQRKQVLEFTNRQVASGQFEPIIRGLVEAHMPGRIDCTTVNSLLISDGRLFENFLQTFSRFKIAQSLIYRDFTTDGFARGVLAVLFPVGRNAEDHFRQKFRDVTSFRTDYGDFQVRTAVYQTSADYSMLLPEQLFAREDNALLDLARRTLAGGRDTTADDTEQASHNLTAVRIFPGYPYLAVAIAEPTFQARQEYFGFLMIALVIVFSFIMIWVLSRLLAVFLVEPFQVFQEGVARINAGEFGTHLDIRCEDEFLPLARSFNEMSRGLLERDRMRRFVSDQVVAAVKEESGTAPGSSGQRVKTAVLFSDIRSFTTISEQHPPQEVVKMLNAYFSAMEPVIRRNGGEIDKFIGDAIQAVFFDHPGDLPPALRAGKAGLAMRRRLAAFNADRLSRGEFPVENGVGIAVGHVIAGKVGSLTGRLDLTVIGDTVQFAAHLEAESKNGRQSMVVASREAMLEMAGQFQGELLGTIPTWRDEVDLPIYEIWSPTENDG